MATTTVSPIDFNTDPLSKAMAQLSEDILSAQSALI